MINLNNKKMNVVKTASNGVVNNETIFLFKQIEDKVIARYSGGGVKRGILVGHLSKSNLYFDYVQEHKNGDLANGTSKCICVKMKGGKLRLTEHFEWSRGIGTNVFMELEL